MTASRKGPRRRAAGAVVTVASLALLAGPAGAIVYGEPDGEAHPYVGALMAERVPGQIGQVCSGTLIDDDVFLTAAHCTEHLRSLGIGPSDVWVTFDPTLDGASPLIGGTYVSHPGFNQARSDTKDIAVILLDEPVAIAPAQLPHAGLLDEMKASHTIDDGHYVAVGYGQVRETRTGAFDSIFRNRERRAAVQTYSALTASWLRFSMNQATGDGGTCFGDSGGPDLLGGTSTVLGVNSYVTNVNCSGVGYSARVDVPETLAWVQSFLP